MVYVIGSVQQITTDLYHRFVGKENYTCRFLRLICSENKILQKKPNNKSQTSIPSFLDLLCSWISGGKEPFNFAPKKFKDRAIIIYKLKSSRV
jgi:hypothetical protein